MNCCDEYGNCRQGRDCPVRTTREPSPKIRRAARWFGGCMALAFYAWLAVSLISK